MLRKIYLSPLGIVISIAMNILAAFRRPFMVYGYRDKVSGKFRKLTRVSSTAAINDVGNIAIGNNVWIGHYNILDGNDGIIIGDGCQLAARVSIFTHSSQDAIRLLGASFIATHNSARAGYMRGRVELGEYTFVGTGSTIMPGVILGRGCLVGANSLVLTSAPDYAILRGSPAQIVGDVRDLDKKFLKDPEIRKTYFDQEFATSFGDKADS